MLMWEFVRVSDLLQIDSFLLIFVDVPIERRRWRAMEGAREGGRVGGREGEGGSKFVFV
jgi:hypothetical protein